MYKQKRERSANFTLEETDRLVSLIVPKRHVIENKKSDATTWKAKEKAWQDIAKAFNNGSVFRHPKTLRHKYEALKRDARKSMAQDESHKNGEITSTARRLTRAEERVKRILLSTEGNESQRESYWQKPSTLPSSSVQPRVPDDKQIGQPIDPTLRDDSNKSIIVKIENFEDMDSRPSNIEVCPELQNETLPQSETDTFDDFDDVSEAENQSIKESYQNNVWHPALSNPNEERYFNKILTEEKIEIAKIQRKILEKELEHKEIVYELEKQHLLLKIKLLEKELKKT